MGNTLSGPSSAPKSQGSKTPLVKQEKVLVRDEAFDAMISLGYNDKQVLKALSRVEQTVDSNAPVEEWIRKALQVI